MIATHIDVTERKRAQAEHERLRQLESDLAHMNRLSIMGELTASLAHEILHPIATARNNARSAPAIFGHEPGGSGRSQGSSRVRRHGMPIEAKISLAASVNTSRKRLRERIVLTSMRRLDEVIVMVQSAIDKNKVSVSTRLMEGLMPVQGDRVQLQQVVLNLVMNAVEAMSSVEGDPKVIDQHRAK